MSRADWSEKWLADRLTKSVVGQSVVRRDALVVPKELIDPFVLLCEQEGLPAPTPEHRFHPVRKWRLDYAWPEWRIGIERDGGVWTQGRHTRGAGFVGDMEKLNAAVLLGWRVLRYTPEQMGRAIDDVKALTE